MAPRVFVSYDREAGAPLSTWVRTFADELRKHGGTDARVDLFDPDAQAGRDLTAYLQDNLQAADAVLLICTPGYKDQLDRQAGVVGFEARILSGAQLQGRARPVIAVVREGAPEDVVPPWVPGKPVDLRGETSAQAAWEALLDALHPERLPKPAEVGPVPIISKAPAAGRFRRFATASKQKWRYFVPAVLGGLVLFAVDRRPGPLRWAGTAPRTGWDRGGGTQAQGS